MKKRTHFFEIIQAGVLMAFAWSLRGQFGPLCGALIPGAASVVILSFLMREEHWRESMGKALLLAPIGFALGGQIGYSELFEAAAHAAAFGVAKDEFARLFELGLIWGGLGGTFLGFGFSEKNLKAADAVFLAAVVFGGVIVWFFHSAVLMLSYLSAALLAAQVYNFIQKKSVLLFILFLTGALAFGAAFLLAAILLSAGYQGYLGTWAWWIYSDQILGFTAGVFFWGMAAGLQQFKLRRFPAESLTVWQQAGFSFWLVFITGINALDVIIYWLKVKSSQNLVSPMIALAVFFTAAVWMVLSKTDADYFNPKLRRTLRNAVLFSFAVWSLEAILKQAVIFNYHHWEGAYTFFVLFFILLCGFLPAQVRILERESWK